ncbi:MAG: hypothetical protein GY832_14475, partial [Chloroflexi bacterium]|nr:hypothetical protein [Chloroflexota bacterium]
MSYSPGLGGGGLFPPDKSGPRITMTPFDLAGMMGPDEERHPGYLIEESQNANGDTCRFVGSENIRGRDLLVVSYDETLGTENVHTKYWFDPERGFLPVQMTHEPDNPERVRRKAMVTDVGECSGGRWFPMRTVRMNFPGPAQTGKEIEVYQLTVQELDVDTPPSDEMLALEIPKGARLHNSVSPQSQRTLQEDQRISVADLGGVKEDMRSKAEERRQERDQMERPLDQSA